MPRDRSVRILLLVIVPMLLPLGCGTSEQPPAPDASGLTGMREAAEAAQAAWGVPADLVLAVSYAETRWRIPAEEAHDGAHEGHAPAPVGVGGLRTWAEGDHVAIAERMLDLDRSVIASDPVAGIVATAAVLRELATRRHGDALPPANDAGAWAEVLADFSALDDPESRRGYAEDVLSWLERGVRTDAADGTVITLAPRAIEMPEAIEGRRGYVSEYAGARWVAASSSNYSGGRSGESVRYVVIHTMQGSYSGSISWFQNPAAGASAHYNIRSSDGEITQMVHERDTAWHAGNLTYNRRSVGIEHEGFVSDPGRWYTDAMYRSSAALTRHLCDKYGIPIDRSHIIGHNEVPDPYEPGRFGGAGNHTDPGSGWDWGRFMDLVRGTPPRPDYDAEFVGVDHPAEMTSGERAVAYVEMRNTGARTWDLTGTWLGTTGPRDRASALYDTENWQNDHRATAADHSDYGTDAVGRFTFMVTAPEVTETTVVSETFGLVQEGVTWFGPEDVTLAITVHPRPGTSEPPPDEGGTTEPPPAEPPPSDGGGSTTEPTEPGGEMGGTEPPADAVPGVTDRPGASSAVMSGGCSAGGPADGGGFAWLFVLLGAAMLRRRR